MCCGEAWLSDRSSARLPNYHTFPTPRKWRSHFPLAGWRTKSDSLLALELERRHFHRRLIRIVRMLKTQVGGLGLGLRFKDGFAVAGRAQG